MPRFTVTCRLPSGTHLWSVSQEAPDEAQAVAQTVLPPSDRATYQLPTEGPLYHPLSPGLILTVVEED